MTYSYRKGRLIKTKIVIDTFDCYIGQYFEQANHLFIDLSFENGEHVHGYTLLRFELEGIELLDPSEHVHYNDYNVPYEKIKVMGIDEI